MTIWKLSYELIQELPSEEKFGLSGQIHRCALSIPANVAEGSSRKSEKDFGRFIQISLGSCFELETYLIGVNSLKLADEERTDVLLELVKEEQQMLSAF